MRLTIAAYSILAQSVFASALPNPSPKPTGAGFSLELVKRYPSDVAQDHEKLATVSQTGLDVTNESVSDSQWTVLVTVGSQTLPIVLDTGSHDLWFESTLEASNMTRSGEPLYTPTATTNSIPGSTWAAYFGNATPVAQGIAYYETLTIGAATIASQVIGAATAVATVNTAKKAGIIGLSDAVGQNNYNTSQPPTVMRNLYTQLGISQFALDLRYDSGSHLDFGFINSSRYTGSITYANKSPKYTNWYIPLDNIYYINNARQTGTISNSYTNLTHIDSGTTLMKFPSTVVQAYYNSFSGSSYDSNNGYSFPCALVKNGTLPSFGVSISGVAFNVPATWMWYTQSGTTCTGSLQSTTSGSILGDMFLRTVYAVFDTQSWTSNGRVGIATKTLPTRALPTGV